MRYGLSQDEIMLACAEYVARREHIAATKADVELKVTRTALDDTEVTASVNLEVK